MSEQLSLFGGTQKQETKEPRKQADRKPITKAHCLFEQSGTFKSQFKALGIEAEDYDILDDFGETDHIVDLFAEIEAAYERERERRFSTRREKAT